MSLAAYHVFELWQMPSSLLFPRISLMIHAVDFDVEPDVGISHA
jgi:hypothetical protein